MQITKNFTLKELCFSKTAKAHNISNAPNEDQINNLVLLCEIWINELSSVDSWLCTPFDLVCKSSWSIFWLNLTMFNIWYDSIKAGWGLGRCHRHSASSARFLFGGPDGGLRKTIGCIPRIRGDAGMSSKKVKAGLHI